MVIELHETTRRNSTHHTSGMRFLVGTFFWALLASDGIAIAEDTVDTTRYLDHIAANARPS